MREIARDTDDDRDARKGAAVNIEQSGLGRNDETPRGPFGHEVPE
jgi:hypothetical protein